MYIIFAFVVLIVLDAVSDATLNKPFKHFLAALHILGWLMFPVVIANLPFAPNLTFWPEFLIPVAGYVCLRYLLFDAVWNIVSGKKLSYIGTTSLYGKILSKVHPSFVFFTKASAGAVGIIILLKDYV